MTIDFVTSSGQSVTFRIAPVTTTEDGDITPIPSALDGLDKYDQHRLALLVGAAFDDQALAPGAGEDE